MSDKELEKCLKQIKEFGEKVARSKSASRKFLIEKGVITPKGNITKRYQGVLCTPNGRF